MIRLATHKDIPQIVEGMLALKAQTGWANYGRAGYTRESLRVFLTERLNSSNDVLYVWDDDSITAFCGGSMSNFLLPPHMPIVLEWGWFGLRRDAAECWSMVKRWGKRRGAELAYRVLARPGSSSTRIREEVTWEVL